MVPDHMAPAHVTTDHMVKHHSGSEAGWGGDERR